MTIATLITTALDVGIMTGILTMVGLGLVILK